jgi:hypothetical protein
MRKRHETEKGLGIVESIRWGSAQPYFAFKGGSKGSPFILDKYLKTIRDSHD